MASTEKRCYYEVLGLSRDCTADEIRSAYKRLALQRHPDKLVKGGVPEAEATAAFQELVNAYEVLSDPKERAWYDSHRNQILFSSGSGDGGSSDFVPDLFSFFSNSVYSGYSDSGRGFYKVYGDLFEKIYANELSFAKKLGLPLPREAPVIGNLGSPYAQVTAFYNYWLGFVTTMDFFWADQYDVMAGPNRKSRRLMEEENKKLRKKAKREYNETVRGLAEFVKKRDKRVIDMQIKRNEENERKKEEEKQRKKELERQKAEMARKYEEPDWAKVEELNEDENEDDDIEERKNELYCVVCRKKFKSDKQWKNHEQSKKHKEKVAELREAFSEEDKEFEATQGHGNGVEDEDDNGDAAAYLSVDDTVNELQEQFEDGVDLHEDDIDDGKTESSEVNEFADDKDDNQKHIDADPRLDDDDEASVLEAMLSGHKNRSKAGNQPKASAKKLQPEVDSDDLEAMELNELRGSRKNRGNRRRKGRRQEEEEEDEEAEPVKKGGATQKNDEAERHDEQYNDAAELSSHSLPEFDARKRADDAAENVLKHPQKAVNKKNTTKKEIVSKSKTAPKGRKQKGAENSSSNTCEKCGVEFESKNKLHKHLGETGHASIKSR
ncbi:DNAJ protein JJJ1 homolog [Andrographis paniculata]|uniref:DNAJ protein JJJ1 homolog n=1 Tax=Andrographis paniculata TaxID=175694 RepID=UPI0021E956EA|nr:DNAJ protein JJJ1 homolog [Andrographis paniculata]